MENNLEHHASHTPHDCLHSDSDLLLKAKDFVKRTIKYQN